MNYTYNKKHVQISVSAATFLGILLGFWMGKRLGVAGVLEGLLVFVTFIVSIIVVFSRIDKKFLPPSDEESTE